MNGQLVTYNVDENITVVTIDRPLVNALDQNMALQLSSIFQELQANLFGELFGTEEMMEGIQSFLEKKPIFKGK
jgi:enoyl-CoA hydratase/carnithine racemase